MFGNSLTIRSTAAGMDESIAHDRRRIDREAKSDNCGEYRHPDFTLSIGIPPVI